MTWGEGARAARRSSWRVRVCAVLAGACAAGLWSAGGAVADTCPVDLFVECPGAGAPAPQPSPAPSPTTTAPPRPTTTTTVAPLTSAEAVARLVVLLNGERRRAGLAPFTARDDVAQIASSWSSAMARAGHLSHNDAYFEKETRRRLRARVLGENVARNRDVEAAHRALMASPPHRANILDHRFVVIGVGAVLANGSWWVTEDFLQPMSFGAAPERTRAFAPGAAAARTPTAATAAPSQDATDGDVLAASAPGEELARLERADGEAVMALAGEAVVDPRWPAGLIAAGALGAVLTLALRRRRRVTNVAVHAMDTDAVAVEGSVAESEPPDADCGVQHQLGVISAWARTLDDRWIALSESERRIATQVIRRTADDALRELDLLPT